ncbi:MAG TPA: 30S ribosomal protein S15 [Candidatus Thermoplasmatota archaeon]|jgi:small subunit ribosomal protein S15|nr:30S ribosomal protein S15 [Candidatus Thermoplasmatota archaeon]
MPTAKQTAAPRAAPTRRVVTGPPKWTGLTAREVEDIVVKMSRDGVQAAEIGLRLRDLHAVPNVKQATGKTVSQILGEHNLTPQIPEDITNLMRRAVNLRTKHLATHRKDHHNARGLQLIESKIRRLALYYKRQGRLPADWKYEPAQAQLLVE